MYVYVHVWVRVYVCVHVRMCLRVCVCVILWGGVGVKMCSYQYLYHKVSIIVFLLQHFIMYCQFQEEIGDKFRQLVSVDKKKLLGFIVCHFRLTWLVANYLNRCTPTSLIRKSVFSYIGVSSLLPLVTTECSSTSRSSTGHKGEEERQRNSKEWPREGTQNFNCYNPPSVPSRPVSREISGSSQN